MSFELHVGRTGYVYTGWQAAHLTSSLERPCANFEFTAAHPQRQIDVKIQDDVDILVDGIVRASGQIFSIHGDSDEKGASRTYAGRSRMADVVDSSAPLTPGIWSNVSAKHIIDALLKPFSVVAEYRVSLAKKVTLRPNVGDSVWFLINRLLEKENLFAYEAEPGVLVIDRGSASGSVDELVFGSVDIVSLESYAHDVSKRYGKYIVVGEGAVSGDDVSGWSYVTGPPNPRSNSTYPERTYRYGVLLPSDRQRGVANAAGFGGRELVIQLTGDVTYDDCHKRAHYEKDVREARSLTFSYKVPSWYRKDGETWTPNTRVMIIDKENDINDEHLLATVRLTESIDEKWAVLSFVAPESYTLVPPELAV